MEDLIRKFEIIKNRINSYIDENKNNIENIEKNKNNLQKLYTLKDGTVFTQKMIIDLYMWTNFSEEYKIKELGGIRFLRDYLGTPETFINKNLKK